MYKSVLLVLVVALTCCNMDNAGKKNGGLIENDSVTSQQDLHGVWQLVEREALRKGNASFYPFNVSFLYDGTTVTVHLVSLSGLFPESEDGMYRLSCKMEGDTLFHILPFNDKWTRLAYLKNGVFYTSEGGKEWEYRKISPDQIAPENKAMLKENRVISN